MAPPGRRGCRPPGGWQARSWPSVWPCTQAGSPERPTANGPHALRHACTKNARCAPGPAPGPAPTLRDPVPDRPWMVAQRPSCSGLLPSPNARVALQRHGRAGRAAGAQSRKLEWQLRQPGLASPHAALHAPTARPRPTHNPDHHHYHHRSTTTQHTTTHHIHKPAHPTLPSVSAHLSRQKSGIPPMPRYSCKGGGPVGWVGVGGSSLEPSATATHSTHVTAGDPPPIHAGTVTRADNLTQDRSAALTC